MPTAATKPTPGPWEVEDLGDEFFLRTNHRWGISSPNCPVHWIGKVEGWGDESEANARLIAASPTMYEFIRSLAFEGDAKALEILESIGGGQ